MKILGLDISTSCTGYCLVELQNESLSLIEAGTINLSKIKSFYKKALEIEEFIFCLNKTHTVDSIVVEENLQAFRPGMSSAKTLQSLAKFNGVVCFLVERITTVSPASINVSSARSKLGIKINRKISSSTKEQVLSWIKTHPTFVDFPWPLKKLKSGPRAGQTIDDPGCFDIADAAVVALSYVI